MKKCVVIGVYPPPYGGATVKCQLFEDLLQSQGYKTKKIDVYEAKRNRCKMFSVLIKCVKAFCSKSTLIYCLDSKRLRAVMFVQGFFRKSFARTTILVVGGVIYETLAEHTNLAKEMKRVKSIWVETDGMKEKMMRMGYANIKVFPNPKTEIGSCKPRTSCPDEPLHLIYFSQISRQKGIFETLKLAQKLADANIPFSLDIYGHVVPEVCEIFEKALWDMPSVKYCGVFDSTKNNVYAHLNQYDLLIFPTKWFTEGVPGVLVEAKMAGIAVVASNRSYNAEIVRESQNEGFVVSDDLVDNMFLVIQQCSEDRELLMRMKWGSYRSRERYSLERFEKIVEKL